MHAIRVRQRHSAVGLTEAKRLRMLALAREWQRAYKTYLRRFGATGFCGRIIHDTRSLREDQRHIGWANPDLTAHYNSLALEAALRVLKSHWAVAIGSAREAISASPYLNQSERRWLRYVLRWPELLQACLDGNAPHVPHAWARSLDERRLAARLKRLVVANRPRLPRPSTRRVWFEIDTNTYRVFDRPEDLFFRGAWLGITGVEPGRRICIPLAGRGLSEFASRTAKSNSRPRLVVVVGARIEFVIPMRVKLPSARSGRRLGIDKGYLTLLTVSDGDPGHARSYGERASAAIADVADGWAEGRRNRDRLRAHERALRCTDAAKSRRVRRNNLGFSKMNRKLARHRRSLRSAVGQAVNQLFRNETGVATLVVEDLGRRGEPVNTHINRRLGRWLKGYLQKRLRETAERNGVELIAVNAAYTSQTCPRCGFVSRANRRAGMFRCTSCDFTGSSDAVAATNVLFRGSDPAITRFTSRRLVKRILSERWRSARSGRAWGSSPGPLPMPTGPMDEPRTPSGELGSLTIPRR